MVLIEYILFAGGSLGCLLTVFLFDKTENVVANRLLGLTFLAYSIDIFYALYTITNLYIIYPQFIGVSGFFPFVYSPALFIYARVMRENKNWFNYKYLYHFIPAGQILFAGVISAFIFSDEVKLSLMNPYSQKSLFIIAIRTLIPFYGITYIVLSLLEVKKYHLRLKENYSNVEKLKLNWLIYLIAAIALVWVLEFIQIILIDIAGKPENITYKYIYAAVTILFYIVTFKSLKQPEVFSEVAFSENKSNGSESVLEDEQKLYLKSGLSLGKAEQVLKKLSEIMTTQRPYLKSNLSLPDLSEMLDVSTHNLSEIINTRLNKSFYDYVNEYRVEEVKKMLMDDKYKSYSVLAIAYEAGFNSKSSFNTIFKKIAGTTPTGFRNNSSAKTQTRFRIQE